MSGVTVESSEGPQRLARELAALKSGAAKAGVIDRLRDTAQRLALRSFATRSAPSGAPWKAGSAGGGDLVKSGALRSSVKTEVRPAGFALTSRVKASNGAYYGGTHQYGRTIKAKGYNPSRLQVTGANSKSRSVIQRKMITNAKGRVVRGPAIYTRAAGSKPLAWRLPNGKWGRAYKVRVPARPIVPRSGTIPPAWAAEFQAAGQPPEAK